MKKYNFESSIKANIPNVHFFLPKSLDAVAMATEMQINEPILNCLCLGDNKRCKEV